MRWTLLASAPGNTQPGGEAGEIRQWRRLACTVQPAAIDPFAKFRLSGTDFAYQHDSIGNSLELAQLRLARILDSGVRQDAVGRNYRRMVSLDDAGADPGLLPQLERRLEQVRVQAGGSIEAG